MRGGLSLTLGTLLLAAIAGALPRPAQGASTLRCTLTNKKVEKCCCEQREVKLYCTLAKKTIDSCCCQPAGAKKTNKKS